MPFTAVNKRRCSDMDEDRANNWFAGIMLVAFAALGAALAWNYK